MCVFAGKPVTGARHPFFLLNIYNAKVIRFSQTGIICFPFLRLLHSLI